MGLDAQRSDARDAAVRVRDEFRAAGVDLVAAKYEGTPQDMRSIARLEPHMHLNLYTDDPHRVAGMVCVASARPNSSVTL